MKILNYPQPKAFIFKILVKEFGTSTYSKKFDEKIGKKGNHQNFSKLFHCFNFLFLKNKLYLEKNSIILHKTLTLKWNFFEIKAN